jgi:hypothetical protein
LVSLEVAKKDYEEYYIDGNNNGISTFTLTLPWRWKVGNGQYKSLGDVIQYGTLNKDGKMTIKKGNSHTYSRDLYTNFLNF